MRSTFVEQHSELSQSILSNFPTSVDEHASSRIPIGWLGTVSVCGQPVVACWCCPYVQSNRPFRPSLITCLSRISVPVPCGVHQSSRPLSWLSSHAIARAFAKALCVLDAVLCIVTLLVCTIKLREHDLESGVLPVDSSRSYLVQITAHSVAPVGRVETPRE